MTSIDQLIDKLASESEAMEGATNGQSIGWDGEIKIIGPVVVQPAKALTVTN